ncbi:MAG: SagB/ThcOx family dehydrogenase [Deltaproteobacteria bacterium]|nr:SagB/ThcOx family dehydrogenase [Deltaproteobacteria bacterium]
MRSYKDAIAFQCLKETKYDRSSIFRKDNIGQIPTPPRYKTYPDVLRIPLPEPRFENTDSLWSILKERRSRRRYASEPISLDTLATLLWATQGITHSTHGYEFRTAPSAGALYPVETYLAIHNVSGLQPGIYHFNVAEFALEEINPGNFADRLRRAAMDQGVVSRAATVLIWTAVVLRSMSKYRDRCIRYIFMDAGHIAQNLHLAATALDLGCCPIGAFYDDEVNEIIKVDGKEETTIYLGAVGKR